MCERVKTQMQPTTELASLSPVIASRWVQTTVLLVSWKCSCLVVQAAVESVRVVAPRAGLSFPDLLEGNPCSSPDPGRPGLKQIDRAHGGHPRLPGVQEVIFELLGGYPRTARRLPTQPGCYHLTNGAMGCYLQAHGDHFRTVGMLSPDQ